MKLPTRKQLLADIATQKLCVAQMGSRHGYGNCPVCAIGVLAVHSKSFNAYAVSKMYGQRITECLESGFEGWEYVHDAPRTVREWRALRLGRFLATQAGVTDLPPESAYGTPPKGV